MFRKLRQTVFGWGRNLWQRFVGNRWGNLAFRVFRKIGTDRVGDMAAAIAYYVLLSAFPLLLGVIGLFGLFLPSQSVQSNILDFFRTYLPGTTSDVISSNIDSIIRLRGPLGVAGLLGLLWTGSALFSSVNRFVNYAWGTCARSYHLRKLQDIGLVLSTGLLLFVSQGIAGVAVISMRVNPPALSTMVNVTGQLISFFLAFLVFLLTYKFMPTVKVRWRDALAGAILGSVLFEALRTIFVLYVSAFSNYSAIYGPLASVIAFLAWVYVSAFVLILGAELGSEWGKEKA